MRVSEIDKTADYHKSMAIAYLKNFADCLDDKGVKTIHYQICTELAVRYSWTTQKVSMTSMYRKWMRR